MVSRAKVITSWTTLSRNLGLGALVVLASIALPTLVGAQAQATAAEPVRVHLTLEAEPHCATQATLREQVRARSQRIAFVDDAVGAPRMRVAIGGAAAGDRVAQLSVEWPDGKRSERQLTAASCASAVEALALLVAMTLDPAAFESEPAGAAGTESPNASGEAGAAGAVPATDELASPTAPANTDANADADTAHADAASSNTAAARGASGHPPTDTPHALGIAQLAAGVRAQLLSGVTPPAMPGLGIYARLAMNGSGWWAPALQLQLAYGWVDDLSEAGGDADFSLASGALDLCPLGLQRPPFWAHACFASTFGRLTASGSHTYAPHTRHELWASLGGRLLLTLGLFRWAELQGGLGLAAPLQRYRFAFSPEVFHRVPSVGLEGHLGAGLRFP